METFAPPAQEARSRPRVWRVGAFRNLWLAQTLSLFGSAISVLALPLVAIVVLHATPLEAGLLTSAQFLPFLLFGLLAGVWADRLPRRPILIGTDVLRGLALTSIPIAYVLGVLTMAQLYVVTFIVGSLTVFFDIAHQAFLPEVLERELLVPANANLELSRSSSEIVGPALGGALVGLIGAPLAVLGDALTYFWSGALILTMQSGGAEMHVARSPEPILGAVRAGVSFVIGHAVLKRMTISTALFNFFSDVWLAVYLIFVVRELGLDPVVIGAILAIGNVGFAVGSVAGPRLAERIGVGWTMIVASVAGPLAMALVPMAAPGSAIPVLLSAQVLSAAAVGVHRVIAISYRQLATPVEIQGRVNATMRTLTWGAIPLGAALGGVLGETIGLSPTLWVGAVGALAGAGVLLSRQVRLVRDLPRSA